MLHSTTSISELMEIGQQYPELGLILQQLKSKSLLMNARDNRDIPYDPESIQGTITLFTTVPATTRGDFYACLKLINLIKSHFKNININWIVMPKAAKSYDLPKDINAFAIDGLHQIGTRECDPNLIAQLKKTDLFIGYPTTHHAPHQDLTNLFSYAPQAPIIKLEEFSGNVRRQPPVAHGINGGTGVADNSMGMIFDENLLAQKQQSSPETLRQVLVELFTKNFANNQLTDDRRNTIHELINDPETLILFGYFNDSFPDLALNITGATFRRFCEALAQATHKNLIILANDHLQRNDTASIEHVGERTYMELNPFPLTYEVMMKLKSNGVFPVMGCTGDQSFLETIASGFIPLYQIMEWKTQNFEDYIKLCRKELGDDSVLVKFLEAVKISKINNIELLIPFIADKAKLKEIHEQQQRIAQVIIDHFNMKDKILPLIGRFFSINSQRDKYVDEEDVNRALIEHIAFFLENDADELWENVDPANLMYINFLHYLHEDAPYYLFHDLEPIIQAKLILQMAAFSKDKNHKQRLASLASRAGKNQPLFQERLKKWNAYEALMDEFINDVFIQNENWQVKLNSLFDAMADTRFQEYALSSRSRQANVYPMLEQLITAYLQKLTSNAEKIKFLEEIRNKFLWIEKKGINNLSQQIAIIRLISETDPGYRLFQKIETQQAETTYPSNVQSKIVFSFEEMEQYFSQPHSLDVLKNIIDTISNQKNGLRDNDFEYLYYALKLDEYFILLRPTSITAIKDKNTDLEANCRKIIKDSEDNLRPIHKDILAKAKEDLLLYESFNKLYEGLNNNNDNNHEKICIKEFQSICRKIQQGITPQEKVVGREVTELNEEKDMVNFSKFLPNISTYINPYCEIKANHHADGSITISFGQSNSGYGSDNEEAYGHDQASSCHLASAEQFLNIIEIYRLYMEMLIIATRLSLTLAHKYDMHSESKVKTPQQSAASGGFFATPINPDITAQFNTLLADLKQANIQCTLAVLLPSLLQFIDTLRQNKNQGKAESDEDNEKQDRQQMIVERLITIVQGYVKKGLVSEEAIQELTAKNPSLDIGI